MNIRDLFEKAAKEAEATGLNYCPVHAGMANEDESSCDFSKDNLDLDEDGEPRECLLEPTYTIASLVKWAESQAKEEG